MVQDNNIAMILCRILHIVLYSFYYVILRMNWILHDFCLLMIETKMYINDAAVNIAMDNEKYILLHDPTFTLCLKKEVEFLKSGNMSLFIDTKEIYVKDGDSPNSNDKMAYLTND